MSESNRHDRTVGAILLVSALLTILAMSHHPSGVRGGIQVFLVHGMMLVLLSCLFFGMAYYSMRRGLGHPLMLAALVAYLLSYLAGTIAGTINGFIVPALAQHGNDIPHALFILAWESNQAFARLGTVATAVAFVLWGIDLLRHGKGSARLAGVFGIVAGVLPEVLLLVDATMDVKTAFVIYSLHAGFLALLGLRLLRGKSLENSPRSVLN